MTGQDLNWHGHINRRIPGKKSIVAQEITTLEWPPDLIV